MYLTYPEYKAWGGTLDQLTFERAEFSARMKIDYQTHNHYRDVIPVPEVVMRLVFELIARGYCGAFDGEDYASRTEGGISVSYASKEGKAEELIEFYLGTEEDELLSDQQGGISFARAERV